MVREDFFWQSFIDASHDDIDAFIAHRIEDMGDEYRDMLFSPSKEELQDLRARLKKMLREVDAADIHGGWK